MFTMQTSPSSLRNSIIIIISSSSHLHRHHRRHRHILQHRHQRRIWTQSPRPTASVRHDAWIVVPFFKAGGRITAGDIHFVEQQGQPATPAPSSSSSSSSPPSSSPDTTDVALIPAGETEFARDKAFGYRSSNLIDWIGEKAAAAAIEGQEQPPAATARVISVSLTDLREGGPKVVRERLAEANGGCVVVNAVEERDLQVRKWG